MAYKRIATIKRNADGTFKFDNGHNAVIAANPDDAGAYLEQQLWPLIEPLFKMGADIEIVVGNG